ncbi:SDR family oxidoreductase [Bradyrhizobium sp. 195]|uniref:SDR family oxidoreductase n=1 Tax=Bradyrhizobium sp. 195 TaxID=2782662 RepID=UPI003211BF98
MVGLLRGQKILITGGGTGLGRSFAGRLAELGAEVVICGRQADVLAKAVEEIQASGGQAYFEQCDVRDAEQVERMFDAIWSKGPLTGLINNAAGNFIARTETLSSRALDAVLGIVLHGSAYCTVAAGRRWIEASARGTILSIVTSAAWQGRAFTVPSAAAKAGVLAMMKSLAVEWGPKGIRTLSLAPGLFPTRGAWDRLYPDQSQEAPQEMQVPLRRLGDHTEIANLVAYLMSDYSSYINGECITIDGGRSLQEGGAVGTKKLLEWTPDQWSEFRSRLAGRT